MNREQEQHLAGLIERRFDGTLTDAEFSDLEARLIADAGARRLFLDLGHQHAALRQLGDSLMEEELHLSHSARRRFLPRIIGAAVAAAVVAIGFFSWSRPAGPDPVATLVSSEHAAWESSLPTAPGSALTAGFLKLRSGVATLRFRSGATVTLEAPAHLVLETPMRGKLLAGTAVVDVPEEAIGFVIDTPDGFAVDHGTQFAVSVDETTRKSAFEVLSGEISVHHPPTGEVVLLGERERAFVRATGLETSSVLREEGELPAISGAVRLQTLGQEISVIRSDQRDEFLHPDFLMAKRGTILPGFDRRSLFGFRIPETTGRGLAAARLRLNLVPCGLGYASRLPTTSVFAVYGVPDPSMLPDQWSARALKWEEVPPVEAAVFLGRFEISRGQRTGGFGIDTPALAEFAASRGGGDAVFLLVRESDEAEGNGLVHAFAGSRHPEASGPVLELEFSE